jgi:hypothetical protein
MVSAFGALATCRNPKAIIIEHVAAEQGMDWIMDTSKFVACPMICCVSRQTMWLGSTWSNKLCNKIGLQLLAWPF